MTKELDFKISIDFGDLDSTIDYLDNLKKRARDLRPVWPKVLPSLKQYMIDNFTAQGLPAGGWKPLDKEYGSWKANNYPGAPMLVQRGALFKRISAGPKLEGGHRTAHFRFGGRIAKFHQYGTTKMPARPILFAPEVWVNELVDEVADYIVEGGAKE